LAPLADLLSPDLAALSKDLGVGSGTWDVGLGASTPTGAEARARVAIGLPANMWAGAEAFASSSGGVGAWAGIGGHF
jgi:hypothetical protein